MKTDSQKQQKSFPKLEKNQDGTLKINKEHLAAAYPEIYEQIELDGFNKGLERGKAIRKFEDTAASQPKPKVTTPVTPPVVSFEEGIISRWKTMTAKQQREWIDLNTFQAYARAHAAGLVKITKNKSL